MNELFKTIWNNAYDVYADHDDIMMWDYLKEQVNNGNIDRGTAEDIAADVIETYNL